MKKESDEIKPSFIKRHLWDMVAISGLVALTIAAFIGRAIYKNNLNGTAPKVALISVDGKIIDSIKLSEIEGKKSFEFEGKKGHFVVIADKYGVQMKEAPCPHKDCIHQGKITTSANPIICVYNSVVLEIKGEDWSHVEI